MYASQTLNSQQKDLIIYAMAILLAGAITLVNYQEKPQRQVEMDQAVEKLLTRMDSASAMLANWGRIDINQ